MTSLLVAAFVGWAIYRRARRSFGRQPVHEHRLRLRVLMLSVAGTLALSASIIDVMLLATLLAGIACGVILGSVGLKHTTFEATAEGRAYIPHSYLGIVVTALLITRILFRLLTVTARAQTEWTPDANPLFQYQNTPLTLGILGVVVGYYVFFYLGVLRRSRELADEGVQSP